MTGPIHITLHAPGRLVSRSTEPAALARVEALSASAGHVLRLRSRLAKAAEISGRISSSSLPLVRPGALRNLLLQARNPALERRATAGQ